MTKVLITITDTNLDTGEYRIDFAAEGSEIDDGRATAAYLTGYFLYTLSDTADFIESVGKMAAAIGDSMTANSEAPILSPTKPSVAYLTLEDADTKTGRYDADISFSGGHPEGDRLPSSAIAMGVFMRNLLASADFQVACWQFAERFVAEHAAEGAEIANPDQSPLSSL